MWRLTGVFGATFLGKPMSVMEGDSVTLHADITDLRRDEVIEWSFGLQGSRTIVAINKAANKISINPDILGGRFRDRLQINDQTGDLTITNITTQHTGLYKINRGTSSRFYIKVYALNEAFKAALPGRHSPSPRAFQPITALVPDIVPSISFWQYELTVGAHEVKSVSVMEGDSVTLHTDITPIQRRDLTEWMFGPRETLIAKIYRAANKISIRDDVIDGRFKDRLQVNKQTGDLTITNITTQHTGLYQMIISYVEDSSRFYIKVYARLPVPLITCNSSQCSSSSSSSSKCVLLCSVLNVRDVSLSWYKGNSLLSSISVSDLNISSISLHLKCLDDSYSCVVNNPISNQTQHLNITDLCQPCSDCVSCCDTTEVVIRLAVSALVGVAAVAVLIYDIRSRRAE
nr:uncharacterized protein LOC129452952 [Misgurnus anguillicaudatus]